MYLNFFKLAEIYSPDKFNFKLLNNNSRTILHLIQTGFSMDRNSLTDLFTSVSIVINPFYKNHLAEVIFLSAGSDFDQKDFTGFSSWLLYFDFGASNLTSNWQCLSDFTSGSDPIFTVAIIG